MQAGEMLKFVKPFNQDSELHINKTERREIQQRFLALCYTLLNRHTHVVRTAEEVEESGPVTVFETSLVIPSQDNSYLHVLVFGRNNSEGFIDINIAIEEHDDEKRPSGGYMYSYDGNTLIRTNIDKEEGDDDDPHFSMIASYDVMRELDELERSDDDDDRLAAMELQARLEESTALGMLEYEMGYDGKLPSLGEVTQLAEILDYALPRLA